MTRTRRLIRFVSLGLAAIAFSAITLVALNSGAVDSFRAFASPYVNPTQAEASIVPSPLSDDDISRPMATNGKILFESNSQGGRKLFTMNPNGSGTTCIVCDEGYSGSFSPDGTKIAFSRNDGLIWIKNADGTGTATSTGIVGLGPDWSPDGKKLVYSKDMGGPFFDREIFIATQNQATQVWGTEVNISNNPGTSSSTSSDLWPEWGAAVPGYPEGRIAYRSNRTGNADIFVASASPPYATTNVTNWPSSDDGPTWSPDGTKIAFDSSRDGNNGFNEIWVLTPATPPAQSSWSRMTNDPDNDNDPTWSPDGTLIAYQSYGGDTVGYDIKSIPSALPIATPTKITNTPFPIQEYEPNWGPGAAVPTRVIRADNVITRPGQPVTTSIELVAQGDETTMSFSVNFEAELSAPIISLGNGVPAGAVLSINDTQVSSGEIGILIASPNTYAAGLRNILQIRFLVSASAQPGPSAITFSSTPTPQSVSSTSGAILPTSYQPGSVIIPSDCAFSLTPTTQSFGPNGGSGSVTVTQTSGGAPCAWQAVLAPSVFPFVTLIPNANATGNGSFTFTVDTNSTAYARTATINIVNSSGVAQPVTVTQQSSSGGCAVTLTQFGGPDTFAHTGESRNVRVSTQPGCTWSVSTDVPWIRIYGEDGGGFFYEVASMASPIFVSQTRYGSININGQSIQVTQVGSVPDHPCILGLILFFTSDGAEITGVERQAAAERLDELRDFRDEVLSGTPRGREFTQDYYAYTGEMVRIMIFNPSLVGKSLEALNRYQPVVSSVLERKRAKDEQARSGAPTTAIPEKAVVYDGELEDLDEILAAFAKDAGGGLRSRIDNLRNDLRDPKVQEEFGVRIVPGAKRPLPDAQRGFVNNGERIVADPENSDSPPSADVAAPPKPEQQKDKAAQLNDVYGRIPLSFEANQGQVDRQVKYLSRGPEYDLFLASDEMVISLPDRRQRLPARAGETLAGPAAGVETQVSARSTQALRMKLAGSNRAPRMKPHDKLATQSNYFIGNDSGKWRTGVPNFSKVEYENVYNGIDLVYYGNQRQLEYDFIVSPGADPDVIRMAFSGAEAVELAQDGDLLLRIDGDEIRLRAPITYQEKNGERQAIASRYELREVSGSRLPEVGFEVDDYDRRLPLVIDPILVYSTYLGGSGEEQVESIAVDAAGNTYLIGFTNSPNFPVTGGLQQTYGGAPQDIFVSKLNAAGTAIVYSTYLGGNGQDDGNDIAVDANGNVYITGFTSSSNFPLANAAESARTGISAAFVAKLNASGSQLVYSTYYGGSFVEFGTAIAVDANGNAYVGGISSSPDFPKVNAIQSNYGGSLSDAFFVKFGPSGSQVLYSSLLGGNGNDAVSGIAVDASGNVYLSGATFSMNFPTKDGFQSRFQGGMFDAFVTKIAPSGTGVLYSTYLGGRNDDRAYDIKLDTGGNMYVAGQTSSVNFPTASALQSSYRGGESDAFITKLSPSASLVYSTYIGGNGRDEARGLALGSDGSAYLTGLTTSTNFLLLDPVQATQNGEFDAFVTKLNAGGTALGYSTYLGGTGPDIGLNIAVDSLGNSYIAGRTASTNFPTFNPLQSANGGGGLDTFITKLAPFAVNVGVSGRVTTPIGLGLRNAVVAITDSQGVRRTATTSSFGLYSFDNVRTGETYTLGVSSKRFRFAPRILQISDSLANVNFVGLE